MAAEKTNPNKRIINNKLKLPISSKLKVNMITSVLTDIKIEVA